MVIVMGQWNEVIPIGWMHRRPRFYFRLELPKRSGKILSLRFLGGVFGFFSFQRFFLVSEVSVILLLMSIITDVILCNRGNCRRGCCNIISLVILSCVIFYLNENEIIEFIISSIMLSIKQENMDMQQVFVEKRAKIQS